MEACYAYSQAKIPEDLLKKAAELSHHFDDLSIRKRLGITDRQLNRIKSLKNDQTHTDQSLSFVELPNSLDTLQAQDPMNITISLPNGLSINISGFGSQPVTAIIERLLKQSESNPC